MADNAIQAVRLLVVSREPAVLRPLWSIGESNSWHLETAGSGWEAMERLQSGVVPDILLLDLPRDDGDSLHVLRWLRRLRPDLPIVLLCHAEDAWQRKEAIRLGAQDCLVRPFGEEQLEMALRRHLYSSNSDGGFDIASEDIEQLSDDTFFVGASPTMQKLRAQAELLAQVSVPVLILGESGSGRETAARLIHKLSVRSGFRFHKVNCAALPGDLLETELFGAEQDASMGGGRKIGKLELCEKGTIFLDEIVEMPLALQEKLLQVLQSKSLPRSGSDTATDADVRILAAADVNVERSLSEKRLREDLYYRLSAFTVNVPPLRQRREEIPLLLRHMMHRLARHYGLPLRSFSPAVLDACQKYSWPGNLRELENFVKRYLMIGEGDLALSSLGFDSTEPIGKIPFSKTRRIADVLSVDEPDGSASKPNSLKSLIQSVKGEAERNAIAAALEKTGWNRKAAARLLKVSYRTILYKIEQYRMSASDTYVSPFVNGNGNGSKGNGHGIKGNGKAS